MESFEVLERARTEHDSLDKRLGSLECVARRVLMDEVRLAGEMRCEVGAFLEELRKHRVWEERALEPLLEGTANRDLHPEALAADHREQEASATGVLEELGLQERPVQILAGLLMDLCSRLRRELGRGGAAWEAAGRDLKSDPSAEREFTCAGGREPARE